GSSSERKPQNQRLGRTSLFHAILHGSYIVWSPPEFHPPVLDIRNGKGGSRIPIARLTDGTWIQQITRLGLQSNDRKFRPRFQRWLNNPDRRVIIREAT